MEGTATRLGPAEGIEQSNNHALNHRVARNLCSGSALRKNRPKKNSGAGSTGRLIQTQPSEETFISFRRTGLGYRVWVSKELGLLRKGMCNQGGAEEKSPNGKGFTSDGFNFLFNFTAAARRGTTGGTILPRTRGKAIVVL